MANTPGGLPYPIGTDRVVDGDNAIRALAEAVEARIGIKQSVPSVPAAGWSGVGSLIARGGFVFLNARMAAVANAADTMLIVPVGMRPPEQIVSFAYTGGARLVTVILSVTGEMVAFGKGTAAIDDLRMASFGPWPVA